MSRTGLQGWFVAPLFPKFPKIPKKIRAGEEFFSVVGNSWNSELGIWAFPGEFSTKFQLFPSLIFPLFFSFFGISSVLQDPAWDRRGGKKWEFGRNSLLGVRPSQP